MARAQIGMLIAASLAAGLSWVMSAAADCVKNCHKERVNCRDVVYPCGTNSDGTIMMCAKEVCDWIEVCEPGCTVIPAPDGPDPAEPRTFRPRPPPIGPIDPGGVDPRIFDPAPLDLGVFDPELFSSIPFDRLSLGR